MEEKIRQDRVYQSYWSGEDRGGEIIVDHINNIGAERSDKSRVEQAAQNRKSGSDWSK